MKRLIPNTPENAAAIETIRAKKPGSKSADARRTILISLWSGSTAEQAAGLAGVSRHAALTALGDFMERGAFAVADGRSPSEERATYTFGAPKSWKPKLAQAAKLQGVTPSAFLRGLLEAAVATPKRGDGQE